MINPVREKSAWLCRRSNVLVLVSAWQQCLVPGHTGARRDDLHPEAPGWRDRDHGFRGEGRELGVEHDPQAGLGAEVRPGVHPGPARGRSRSARRRVRLLFQASMMCIHIRGVFKDVHLYVYRGVLERASASSVNDVHLYTEVY